jgi:hypothetical protein
MVGGRSAKRARPKTGRPRQQKIKGDAMTEIDIFGDEKMNEIEITVTFKVRAHVTPIIPAKTDGPPESCYPAEGGEIEWQFADENEFNRAVEAAIWED